MKKYLLYALGEVVLVIVGILIALQINNANQDRIRADQEKKLFEQIESDLQSNLADVEDLLDKYEVSSNSADSLLKSFRTKEKVTSFAAHVSIIHRRFFFTVASSGYSQLGSSMGNVVQNSELRNKITQIYEGDFVEIQRKQEMLFDHLQQNLMPLSNRLFSIKFRVEFKISGFDDEPMDFYDPLNFDELMLNTEYANTIATQKRLYTYQVSELKKTQSNIRALLKDLEEEIQSED